jgi:hypothetical protein
MHVLDYSRNVIVRKFRVLLGQTALYRIDLCPLFLRHAQYHKQRTGFSPRITGFSPGYEPHDDPVQRAWCRRGRRGWAGRPPGRRADLEQCRWDLRQVVAARKTVGWPHLCEFVALVVTWTLADGKDAIPRPRRGPSPERGTVLLTAYYRAGLHECCTRSRLRWSNCAPGRIRTCGASARDMHRTRTPRAVEYVMLT